VAAMDAVAASTVAAVARAALTTEVVVCCEAVVPFLRPFRFQPSKKSGANFVFRRGRLGSRVGYSRPGTNSRGRLSRPIHDVLVPKLGGFGLKDLMLRLQLTTYDMSTGRLEVKTGELERSWEERWEDAGERWGERWENARGPYSVNRKEYNNILKY